MHLNKHFVAGKCVTVFQFPMKLNGVFVTQKVLFVYTPCIMYFFASMLDIFSILFLYSK